MTTDGPIPVDNALDMEGISPNLSPRAQAAIAATPVLNPVKPVHEREKKAKDSPIINDGATQISLSVKIDEPDDDTENKKNYFCRLPHSGYTFDVRGLLVEEEDRIKSSNTSTKRAAETIMQTLYNCISNDIKTKDHPFGRFDTFCKSISIADRDALALSVIEKTYESTHEMNIRCGRCGKNFNETICLPQCLEHKHYLGTTPLLQKRHVLEFPELKWKMYLKIPTLWDEMKTLSTNEKNEDAQKAAEYIYIDKLEYQDTLDGGQKMNDTVTNYIQIYGMLKKQPAIIRKRIEKEYEKFRGDYGVTGRYETSCQFCDSPIIVNIIPITHFLFLVQ